MSPDALPATSSAPVAPSRQCVGCGFDVMGIAMDGVCSECQKPVRETVDRRLLRESPKRCRSAVAGASILIFGISSVVLTVVTSVALLFIKIDISKWTNAHPVTTGCTMLSLIPLAAVSAWLLMAASLWPIRTRLAWLGATIVLPLSLVLVGAVLRVFLPAPHRSWFDAVFPCFLFGVISLAIPLIRAAASVSLGTDNHALQRTASRVRVLCIPWTLLAIVVCLGLVSVDALLPPLQTRTERQVASITIISLMIVIGCYLVYVTYFMVWLIRAVVAERRLGTTLPP